MLSKAIHVVHSYVCHTSYFSDWSYVGRGIAAATSAGTAVLLNTALYSPGRTSGGSK